MATTAIVGSSELRSTCRRTTVRCGRPLITAVRCSRRRATRSSRPAPCGDVAEQHKHEGHRGGRSGSRPGREAGPRRRGGGGGEDAEREEKMTDQEDGPHEVGNGGGREAADRNEAVGSFPPSAATTPPATAAGPRLRTPANASFAELTRVGPITSSTGWRKASEWPCRR